MKLAQLLRRVYQSGKPQQPVRRPKKERRHLMLESLEERTVPTVIYPAVFGPEAPAGDGGDRLSSPPVYLILWGSYWNGAGSQQANIVTQAAAAVMASPYLTGIQQYGSDGHAAFGNAVFGPVVNDVSDPSNGNFGDGEVDDIIDNAVDQAFLPQNDNAIYVVVTPPGVKSNAGLSTFGTTSWATTPPSGSRPQPRITTTLVPTSAPTISR